MRERTSEDIQRLENTELIKSILGDDFLSFKYGELQVSEHRAHTVAKCGLDVFSGDGLYDHKQISAEGHGLVDTLFNAMLIEYAQDCVSTAVLKVHEFYIFVDKEDLQRRKREGLSGADALVQVCLVIDNGDNGLIPFRESSRSVINAMASVVFSAMEFFINSERAVHKLRECIEDARKRNRSDLVELYTFKMVELVKNASYVESLREDA